MKRLTKTLCFLAAMMLLPVFSLHADEPATEFVPPDHAARMKRGLKLFSDRVRPLLRQHCLDCHGGKETKADFSLASRELLLESGFVDLKNADESDLVLLIKHEQEPHMPLKMDKLSQPDIADITQWLSLGAPYDGPLAASRDAADASTVVVTDERRQFWSFRPLSVVAPPRLVDEQASAWVRTPIDHFVQRKLIEHGLRPNPPADRRVLIRRAYLDLIGLPPTPQEIDQFVADPDRDAYEKLIDRLLASDHYGERWARHWIDVARFAESGGFEHDADRPYAYHYRDFLIRALNDDMPFDQFIAWQLAGDELAPEHPLAMRATGFLGAGVFPSQLTEAEFESARYDELDDIVTTTGVAFLGLSIGCARCHDHKFDPIPSEDYYRIAAAFTKTIRSHVNVPVHPDILSRRRQQHDRQLVQAKTVLEQFESTKLKTAFLEYLDHPNSSTTARESPWRVVRPDQVSSSANTSFEVQNDDSVLSVGDVADKEVITLEVTTPLDQVHAMRLEALTHESLPHRGPGRADNGNFALGNITAAVQPEGANDGERQTVKLVSATATHQQNTDNLSVAASIDDDPVSGWAVDAGGIGKDQAAAFVFEKPLEFSGDSVRLVVQLTLNHPNNKHTLGRFRLSLSKQADATPTVDDDVISSEVVAAIAALGNDRQEGSADWNTAWNWFRTTHPRWQKLSGDVQRLISQAPAAEEMVQVSSAGFASITHHADGRGYPHFYPQTYVLVRGDVNQKKEVATPSFLQVLMPPGATPQRWRVPASEGWTRTSFDRASLANWITDTKEGGGGLAARVIVNRLWQHHLGRGIVSTPNDFGLQGERPTHPDLLDWLATELVSSGWQLKPIHKMIMTSGVYMQSSDFDEARASIDRENLYHWRRVPQRLDGEAIRDSVLAASGVLDPTMYGPGSLNESMHRRSIYFTVKRSGLIPSMMAFDWPEHLVSIGQRASTTVAPQALVFLNGPQTRHCAVTLANRLSETDASNSLAAAYRSILGRHPTDQERQLSSAFLTQQIELHRAAGSQQSEKAALADLCQTLFCMNEFIYVD